MRAVIRKRSVSPDNVVDVIVPPSEKEKCESFFLGRPLSILPHSYIKECKAYVVKDVTTNVYGLLPAFLIPERELPEIDIEIDEKEKVIFTIADDIVTDKGDNVSGDTCDGYIVEEFDNGQVLLRLPDYDETCYFSGYDLPILVKKAHYV